MSGQLTVGAYSADEDGYKAYLKDWVAANPAVQANIDEFIAAGGVAEIPAFDPNLAPD